MLLDDEDDDVSPNARVTLAVGEILPVIAWDGDAVTADDGEEVPAWDGDAPTDRVCVTVAAWLADRLGVVAWLGVTVGVTAAIASVSGQAAEGTK